MKTPSLLPTLSTMTLALACAVLLIVADPTWASAPAPTAPCCAQLP